MYEMTYVSPDGKTFALTGGQIEVAEGGVDKLTGSVKERAYTAVGMPGQLLESHVIEPIRGTPPLVTKPTPTGVAPRGNSLPPPQARGDAGLRAAQGILSLPPRPARGRHTPRRS